MTARTAGRQGFTLVEVMVGVALASIIALMIHSLAGQIARATREAKAAETANDRRSNLRRWLKAAFLSSDAGPDTGPFAGKPDRVRFDTWLQQPGGWFARRTVVLAVRDGRMIAIVNDIDSLRLADSVQGVEFSYLVIQGSVSRWVGEWQSETRAPPAVRMVLWGAGFAPEGDTLLFATKDRG